MASDREFTFAAWDTLDSDPDPNPPPGAPDGFPVQYTSPSGVRSHYIPPYSRQDLNYGLVQGIGIKICRPTTWVDQNGEVQEWDDDWERRYPAWDCSYAGMFEELGVKRPGPVRYSFQVEDDPVGPDDYWDLDLPRQFLPLQWEVPLEMMAWARRMADRHQQERPNRGGGKHCFKDAIIVPATAFNRAEQYVADGDWGSIGDKVTISLPELCPNDMARLDELASDGRYMPDWDSLYAHTERTIGFEYRTQLLGAAPGISGTRDPGHSVRNVKIENLWFILLFHDQLPVYHFWHRPAGRPEPLVRSNYEIRKRQPVNKPSALVRRGHVRVQKREDAPRPKRRSTESFMLPSAVMPPELRSPDSLHFPPRPTTLANVVASARRGLSRAFGGKRRFKKAILIDTPFQPSPTVDLAVHPMATRHRPAPPRHASTVSPTTPPPPFTHRRRSKPRVKKIPAPRAGVRKSKRKATSKKKSFQALRKNSKTAVAALEQAAAAVTTAADFLDAASEAMVPEDADVDQTPVVESQPESSETSSESGSGSGSESESQSQSQSQSQSEPDTPATPAHGYNLRKRSKE